MTSAPLIAVEVEVFARLRELCGGSASIALRLPVGADTAQCFAALAARFPALEASRSGLAVAVNEQYAGWHHSLREGDVVAFIPPVSGG